MPFEPGRQKTGGRKKGVRNKFNRDLAALCEAKNFNPFEALLELAQNPKTKGGLKLGALKELCEYIFPKRRRVEFDESNLLSIAREVEQLSRLPTDELKKLAQEELAKEGDETA